MIIKKGFMEILENHAIRLYGVKVQVGTVLTSETSSMMKNTRWLWGFTKI